MSVKGWDESVMGTLSRATSKQRIPLQEFIQQQFKFLQALLQVLESSDKRQQETDLPLRHLGLYVLTKNPFCFCSGAQRVLGVELEPGVAF